MITKTLNDVVERAKTWPEEAQNELAEVALEIEAELTDEPYSASSAELEGIKRGWRDAEQGKFASEEDVEAVFAKYRR